MRRAYVSKLDELVSANKEKYGVDKEARLTFDKESGSLYVGRLKVGFVTVGEEVFDDGAYLISFQTNPREADLVKIDYEKLAVDFQALVL